MHYFVHIFDNQDTSGKKNVAEAFITSLKNLML